MNAINWTSPLVLFVQHALIVVCFLSHVQILIQSNSLSERIRVLEGEVEEISCPDMVDIIISEPMGYMLLNDRLMGTFLHAKKWLKPNGRGLGVDVP